MEARAPGPWNPLLLDVSGLSSVEAAAAARMGDDHRQVAIRLDGTLHEVAHGLA